jgi:hypothetical protein
VYSSARLRRAAGPASARCGVMDGNGLVTVASIALTASMEQHSLFVNFPNE